ncbi:hypothetical protein V8C44DRAFT_317661 [Trichoderma aethiopicum]
MQNCAGSPGTNYCSSFNRAEPFGQRHEAELRQKRRSMTETAAFSIMCQRQPQQRLRRHACDFLFSPPPPEGAPSPEKLHLNALQLQQRERRKKENGQEEETFMSHSETADAAAAVALFLAFSSFPRSFDSLYLTYQLKDFSNVNHL